MDTTRIDRLREFIQKKLAELGPRTCMQFVYAAEILEFLQVTKNDTNMFQLERDLNNATKGINNPDFAVTVTGFNEYIPDEPCLMITSKDEKKMANISIG
ncbi:MAG: hypothetical protein K0S38_308 [Candidatus Paceibacter sp.]|jgi:hypothetical protein|nr:hypothetical protein [Candidatus Paceibacter sp.]